MTSLATTDVQPACRAWSHRLLPALAAEAPAPEPEATQESRAPATDPEDRKLDELAEVIVYATSGQLVAGLHADPNWTKRALPPTAQIPLATC